jgi:LacI family transcriptional regulator, galactose operon repressor
MPVTLADIARELGVSKMTVSRAINNHPLISAETRARVLEVARRMNYQPNQYARALATKRSHLIGVVVPDLMNLYFAEVLWAIETVARPAGFQLLICSTGEDDSRELGEVEALLQRTDGLIISSVLPPTESKTYRKMIREGAKIVLIDRTMNNLSCPTVATDNVLVGKLATQYLIDRGHRRIGHLRGDSSSVGADRLEGYRQALAANKIRYDESLVKSCGLLESDGYETMRQWLKSGDVASGIFAVNDPTAIGAMQALTHAGLKPGVDVALVGAGNIHYGDMLGVPLTTVSWSRKEMGEQAARLLVALIEDQKVSKQDAKVVLAPELVVRRSGGEQSAGREHRGKVLRYSVKS